MNYGDYAYIEAFPRGMFQFFPDPNVARRAQLFEVWIRPVRARERAHGAAHRDPRARQADRRTACREADFEATRDYLMKNVYRDDGDARTSSSATRSTRSGTASAEFTRYMRERCRR